MYTCSSVDSKKVRAGDLIEGSWSESLGFDSRKYKRKKNPIWRSKLFPKSKAKPPVHTKVKQCKQIFLCCFFPKRFFIYFQLPFSPAIKILFLRSLAAQSTFALYTCKMKMFCEIRSIMLEFIWEGIKWRKWSLWDKMFIFLTLHNKQNVSTWNPTFWNIWQT